MRKWFRVVAFLSASIASRGNAEPIDQTQPAVVAAEAFLASLSTAQRGQVVYAFDDDTQRARWSNFPTGFVPRGGISLEQMTPVQRDAVSRLLATVLSPMGLQKIEQIRQADEDFKANGSKRGPSGVAGGPRGPRGPGGTGAPAGPPPGGPGGGSGPGGAGPFAGGELFGSDLYYVSILGRPSTTRPWMLQFGGHHLALNITIAGAGLVMTPSLTGAQPARFQRDGRVVRPLGRESDEALALLRSLDDRQRGQAVLGYTVADLVLGPGQDGKTIVPDGLKASTMNAAQRALLLDVIGEWVGIANDAAAHAKMKQVMRELDETWFAWSGPTTGEAGTNITAYYRIQGPHLVIEYAPQSDEPDNHVHTIYRDPTDDYGRSSIGR